MAGGARQGRAGARTRFAVPRHRAKLPDEGGHRRQHERAGGRRALLNLGHTFAHALEAAAGYDGRLLHGEAVSIGLVMAMRLSVAMGVCPGQDGVRAERHLQSLGLKTGLADIQPNLRQTPDELLALMSRDKKSTGGKIGFILLKEIGQAFQSFDVEFELVRKILAS